MPQAVSRRDNDKVVRIGIAPDGSGGVGSQGVNLVSLEGSLNDFELARGERVRTQAGALVRAPGSKRVAVLTNNTGSRTFGADTKYATIPAASQLFLSAGSWALRVSFIATRPSIGAGYLLSSMPSGVSYNILAVALLSTGAIRVTYFSKGNHTRIVTTAVVADGATVHLLVVFDHVDGTLTVYVDGVSSGTPLTGISVSERLKDVSAVWCFGVEKETAAAVTGGSHFDGAMDAFTLFSWPGVTISSGQLEVLLKHTFRQWPNPDLPCVVAHYDMDEASGTTLYDRSRYKNHATLVGATTATAKVALSFPVGNYVGTFQRANGKRINCVAAGGSLLYEVSRPGV